MQLFDTYFQIKDKKPLVKWKRPIICDDEKTAKRYEEYGGRLAPDVVLIDIDDGEQAQVLLDIIEDLGVFCQVRKTDRGMHFYFKNDGSITKCGTKLRTALGLTVDIKTGTTNSYAKLKSAGKERPVIYDNSNGKEYQAPPKFLTLISVNAVDVWNMDEGKRNSGLFKYIINLVNAGLSKEEARECIRLINDYILHDPLEDNELETILRDDAFKNVTQSFFTEKGRFLHRDFADYISAQYHVRRINGELYLYKDWYVQANKYLPNIMRDLIKDLTMAQKREAIDCLSDLHVENIEAASPMLIRFNNGILNLETGAMMPPSPDVIVTNNIPWDYCGDAKPNIADTALLNVSQGNLARVRLLEEIAGYTMFRRNELRKAFILIGQPLSGKSTYLDMIKHMLGEDNVSELSLQDLNSRFRPVRLANKLANIGDDIPESFVDDVSVFKKVVSGEAIEVEYKGKDAFSIKPYAKFIFSVNEMPRIKDNGGGALNRLMFLPFNADLKTLADFDPFFRTKLFAKEATERFIWLAVEGLKRVLKNQGFTADEEGAQVKEEYARENDPFLDFISDYGAEDLTRESVSYWFEHYRAYCLNNGRMPISNKAFGRRVTSVYPDLRSKQFKVGGKVIRRYIIEAKR